MLVASIPAGTTYVDRTTLPMARETPGAHLAGWHPRDSNLRPAERKRLVATAPTVLLLVVASLRS